MHSASNCLENLVCPYLSEHEFKLSTPPEWNQPRGRTTVVPQHMGEPSKLNDPWVDEFEPTKALGRSVGLCLYAVVRAAVTFSLDRAAVTFSHETPAAASLRKRASCAILAR